MGAVFHRSGKTWCGSPRELEPNPNNPSIDLNAGATGSNAVGIFLEGSAGGKLPSGNDKTIGIGPIFQQPSAPGKNGISIAPLPAFEAITTLKFKRRNTMLWTILVILLILWLIGAIGGFAGNLIHLLLVVALVIFIINLVSGRRAV